MCWFSYRIFFAAWLALGTGLTVVACGPDLDFEKDHCLNDEKDDDETDVDCGGESCEPCVAGQACLVEDDCLSRICSRGECIVESCDDGIPNGLETDVDCGGPDPECARCDDGEDCEKDGDCRSNICTEAGTCGTEPTCADETANGGETDIDCGGPTECPRCNVGRRCEDDSDCESNLCTPEGRCDAIATCDDEIRNGLETDVDCGGADPDCERCDDGKDCARDGDCRSNICTDAGTCGTEPTCADETANGGETDIDCGGATNCARCGVGRRCDEDSDCQSNLCTSDGRCDAVPTCDDAIQNGSETDRDCGGPNPDCDRCRPGEFCERGSDCDSGVCSDGQCDIVCGAGTADCDRDLDNGCETSISGDVAHCGECDNACKLSHAEAVCNAGSCGIEFVDGKPSCDDGWADCDGDPENGCETNLLAETDNCGACGNACEVLGGEDFGTPLCAEGVCSAICTAPHADCEEDPITVRVYECETNTDIDPENCNGCGTACPEGSSAAVCRNGICGFSVCDYPTEDCDFVDPDCEADLTSLATCGDCATTCAPQNVVTGLCTTSGCDYDECRPGYGDCDGSRANGCEENLNTSSGHCGACGAACPREGTNVLAATCVGGNCEWGSCASGYAHCDDNLDNGCETDTNTVTDCGGCDLACSTAGIARACTGGECTGTCITDRADCNDDKRTDGCETNTATSVSHCGGCGMACSASNIATSCGSGVCNGACNAGYRDCNDDKRTDGCETNLNTSAANCGGCAQPCSTNGIVRACSAGSCEEGVCRTDRADCNEDKRTDGCEVNLLVNPDHCGECDRACSGLTPNCVDGTCTGSLRVTYSGGQLSDDQHVTGDNQIAFSVGLCNDGSTPVVLTSIRLRYWLTFDGRTASISGGSRQTDATYAADYIQIAVPDGELASNACILEVAVNAVSSNGNFDESDDFSRPPSVTQGDSVDNPKVTVYQNHTYIQGQQPPLP